MQATNNQFHAMGKTELREACKQHGVKNYGKMNNDGMRAALVAATAAVQEPVAEETPATDPSRSPFADFVAPPAPPAPAKNVTVVRDGKKVEPAAPKVVEETEKLAGYLYTNVHKCPKCGKERDQTWANEGVSLFCHSCETTYSASTGKEIRTGYTRENVSKGYNIEKDRPKQNGVTRPSSGTVCGQVWAAFDAQPTITAKDLPALAEAHGWNKNNVSCEFYVWRKFNGIRGRQAK
jgi:hypothetical protein